MAHPLATRHPMICPSQQRAALETNGVLERVVRRGRNPTNERERDKIREISRLQAASPKTRLERTQREST